MTFYHVRWCPECGMVREKLEELNVSFEDVVVPDTRMFRKQVFEVSGQYYVPVIKDGDLVLTETRDILAYLDDRYGPGGAGAKAAAKFASRAQPQSATLGDDDEHPSCRLT
ncbi:MAG TPA: glutathione S-transferase N-terminal domain-containing protein [Nitrospiraceae bacterium]